MANQPVNFEDYNIVVEPKVANIKVGFPWKADGTASHQVEVTPAVCIPGTSIDAAVLRRQVQLVDAGETLDLEEIEAKKEILEVRSFCLTYLCSFLTRAHYSAVLPHVSLLCMRQSACCRREPTASWSASTCLGTHKEGHLKM